METLAALGWLTAVILAVYAFGPSVVAYAKRKGANLADREDVGPITELAEGVKHRNARDLEELRARQQLRMAAADRRLAAHQEAFALWRKLIRHASGERIGEVVLECQDWWEHNCLFLSPQSREAFSRAYSTAHSHRELVRALHFDGQVEQIERSWATVMAAGTILVQSVDLPPLTEDANIV